MAVAGLENVSAISPAFFEIENRGLAGVETDHEDNNSVISEQFSDLGGVERERVRQNFQEWMKCGAKGGPSNYGFGLKRPPGPQWLGENECERVRIIREWVQMNNEQINTIGSIGDGAIAEVGAHIEQVRDGLVVSCPEIGVRRPIRKLCGRQTLLDLLLRAHSERKRELQGLLQQRPVSDFAHRNRIQALLRGRFLRNERSIPDKRPSSVAATELRLLRQRHTVSDLREGFLSKLDNSSTSVNNDETDSTFSEENKDENSGSHTSSDIKNAADGNRILQESAIRVIEVEAPALNNKGSEEEVSDQSISASITNETSLESENLNNGEPISGSSSVHEVDGDTIDLQGNMNEEFDWQENASVQTEEFENSVVEIHDSAWQQLTSVSFTEWANNAEEQNQMQESRENWPIQDLQEAIDSWLDMPSGEDSTSIGRLATYYIPDEDNNGNIMELRELSSRRRVSSLLRSSFRETLDQVLQSFVERQESLGDWMPENTFSSPVLIEQNQELPRGDQISVYDDVERNPFGLSLNIVTGAQPLWVGEFQSVNWPRHNSNQRLATDWELMNEMRIEMARLHQRMNDMQSMLEACMEMQIELQRLFHQDVSAALNRSTFSRDESEESRLNDESRWDLIRKGICCLCRDRKIDSLLYRCGHMCTCSSCAESLVQHTGKCPMCQAPVVEAVHAYCIQ